MNNTNTRKVEATPAVDRAAPCSASFTEGPWRYQKETTVTILGEKVPPRVRYQVYKDGGIYGHPATCDREEDARAIAAVPLMFAALERLEKACDAVHEVSGGTTQHQAMWLAQLEARDAISEVTGIHWQNAEVSQEAGK